MSAWGKGDLFSSCNDEIGSFKEMAFSPVKYSAPNFRQGDEQCEGSQSVDVLTIAQQPLPRLTAVAFRAVIGMRVRNASNQQAPEMSDIQTGFFRVP